MLNQYRITVFQFLISQRRACLNFLKVSSRCWAIPDLKLKSTRFHSLCSVKKVNVSRVRFVIFTTRSEQLSQTSNELWIEIKGRDGNHWIYDIPAWRTFMTFLSYSLSKFVLACYKSEQFHSNALCTLPLRHFCPPQCFILAVWKSRLAPTVEKLSRSYVDIYDTNTRSRVISTKEVIARCFKVEFQTFNIFPRNFNKYVLSTPATREWCWINYYKLPLNQFRYEMHK